MHVQMQMMHTIAILVCLVAAISTVKADDSLSAIYGEYATADGFRATIVAGGAGANNPIVLNWQLPDTRPQASGHFNPVTGTGDMNFLDDTTYTFTYDAQNQVLNWSNNSKWKKITIYGEYVTADGVRATILSTQGQVGAGNQNLLLLNWNNGRPQASGHFNPFAYTGDMTFPDDSTYTFTFDVQKQWITWSNKSVWKKVIIVLGEYATADGTRATIVAGPDSTSTPASIALFLNWNNGRVQASGHFNPQTGTGDMNFPDDGTYTFTYDYLNNVIAWSNNSKWNKITIYGVYSTADGSTATIVSGGVVRAGNNNYILLNWANGRPQAHGDFNPYAYTGDMTFPDDSTYTFTFDPQNFVINWSNKSVWKKRVDTN